MWSPMRFRSNLLYNFVATGRIEIPLLFSGQKRLVPLGIGRIAVRRNSSGAVPVASIVLKSGRRMCERSMDLKRRDGIPS